MGWDPGGHGAQLGWNPWEHEVVRRGVQMWWNHTLRKEYVPQSVPCQQFHRGQSGPFPLWEDIKPHQALQTHMPEFRL